MNLQKYIETYLNALEGYYFELGVFSEKAERKIQIGVTNAELMFIHENGSPLRSIPSRPVLQMTIDDVSESLIKNEYNKAVDAYIDNNFDISKFEQILKRTAIKIENHARSIIYDNDGRLIPNSESVAKRKKGNHPLFDTGQLARSITCRLYKNGEQVIWSSMKN